MPSAFLGYIFPLVFHLNLTTIWMRGRYLEYNFTIMFLLCYKVITIIKIKVFPNSAPLGRVGHRVAMSRCLSVCLFVPSGAVFF